MDYQYWNDKAGETYAVMVENGVPIYQCGPLTDDEVNHTDPSDYNFDDPFDDNANDYSLHTVDYETIARERVADNPELASRESVIFYDWQNWDEHVEWVAAADADEIIDWADEIIYLSHGLTLASVQ